MRLKARNSLRSPSDTFLPDPAAPCRHPPPGSLTQQPPTTALGNPPAHTKDGSGPWEAVSKGSRGSWWLRAPAHPNPDRYPGGIWPEGSPALGLAEAACVPTHLPTPPVFLSPRPREPGSALSPRIHGIPSNSNLPPRPSFWPLVPNTPSTSLTAKTPRGELHHSKPVSQAKPLVSQPRVVGRGLERKATEQEGTVLAVGLHATLW